MTYHTPAVGRLRGFHRYQQRRRIGARHTLDRFAEALANGAPSISAAGREAGVGQQRASQLFAQLRSELGAQAE